MVETAHLPAIIPETPLSEALSCVLWRLQHTRPADFPANTTFTFLPFLASDYDTWLSRIVAAVTPVFEFQDKIMSEQEALTLTHGSPVLSAWFLRLFRKQEGLLEQDVRALLLAFIPTQPHVIKLLFELHHTLRTATTVDIDMNLWESERVLVLSLLRHKTPSSSFSAWQAFVSLCERQKLLERNIQFLPSHSASAL